MKRKAKMLIMAAIGCLMALSLCAGLYNASAAEGTDPVLITDKASVRIMNAEKKHVDAGFEVFAAGDGIHIMVELLNAAVFQFSVQIAEQDGFVNEQLFGITAVAFGYTFHKLHGCLLYSLILFDTCSHDDNRFNGLITAAKVRGKTGLCKYRKIIHIPKIYSVYPSIRELSLSLCPNQ